ncbi:ATP-binding protein [Polaribacter porphyrae]|uniref:histidine kinase n=1 Tax=Polaribacter porphyrae TaxID=1137780 RepID=A0A2S7WRL0_9FLAO|nr:sensor histidine kinase [Polaribacter porphyrae]PQJ80225.1 hypothetical protein BTO18_14030 [Polaribacter porphyrae]
MKKLFFLLLFLFVISTSFSQNNKEKILNLKSQLLKTDDDSLKAKIYGDLTWYYKEFSIDSSLKYGNKGLDLLKIIDLKPLLAQQYSDLAGVYLIKGDTKLSEEYYKKASSIRKDLKDTLGVAKINANLMAFYIKFNQPDSAMIYGLNAVKIFEQKGILNYSNIIKSNLASLNKDLRNYQKALNYNFEILDYALEIKDEKLTGNLYNNIASIYRLQKKFKKSIQYYKRAIELTKKNENFRTLSIALNGLARIYFKNNEVNKAIETSNEALKYKSFLNSEVEIAGLNYLLGEQYFELSQLKKSKAYLLRALPYFEKNIDKQKVAEIYYFLSIIYGVQGNKKKAIQYKVKKDSLSDSYFNEKNSKELVELEVKYQTEKKENQLLQTRTEKAETELSLAKTKIWAYILFGGLAISIVLFFAISQRRKRKNQEAIVAEKEKGFKAIIDAQEEERNKIARELHDGVVQQIGSVILKSRNLFSKQNLTENEDTKEVLESLENSNKDLRNISHQMMPRALKELGIIPALNDLLEGSLKLSNITYSLEHYNIDERLPEKIEVTIYRITQELINNIIKHSKASEVSVQLFNSNNTAILIVEDNGVGFSSKEDKKGIGLLNITSRLDMVNGNVNFEPSPKSGTLVTIKIPL